MSKTIHFLKPRGLNLSVFNSQILSLHNTIKEKYRNIDTKVWVPFEEEINNHTFPVYKKTLRRKDIKKADILYTRSIIDYILCRLIFVGKDINYIYDFRALLSFESWYRNKNLLKFIILFCMEGVAYYTANQVNAVSKNLAQKLKRLYKKKRCINIIPCLTGKVKQREKNNIGSFDFVYIGGTSKWQCIDQMFNLFAKIKKHIPNATFTVYTKNDKIITKYSNKYDLNINCKYIDQKQMFDELKKYDFGFLLREKNIINQVASPIKFLEYLSVGIIPIITRYVGDYTEIVAERDIGIVTDLNNIFINRLIEKIKSIRVDPLIYERIFNYVNRMTWNNYDKHFIQNDLIR